MNQYLTIFDFVITCGARSWVSAWDEIFLMYVMRGYLFIKPGFEPGLEPGLDSGFELEMTSGDFDG